MGDLFEDLANGKYKVKSKYDNYSTEDFITEIEANNKQIQSLNSSISTLNSRLWTQKQINIGLGIAYAILLLCIIIRKLLKQYKAKIRKELLEEIKAKQDLEEK